MTEGENARLIAWAQEMRRMHARLRAALEATRGAVRDDDGARASPAPTDDLLLFCRGFCTALAAHHQGEDRSLFPAIEAAHPQLAGTLRTLSQDHSMIEHLLGGLQQAARSGASPSQVDQHLEGIAAIMESHFRYEERELLAVLEELQLDGPVEEVLGPL